MKHYPYHFCAPENVYKPYPIVVCSSGCKRYEKTFELLMSDQEMNKRNAELMHNAIVEKTFNTIKKDIK